MPEATLLAFADHGAVGGVLPADGGDAEAMLARIGAAGVDVDALGRRAADQGPRRLRRIVRPAARRASRPRCRRCARRERRLARDQDADRRLRPQSDEPEVAMQLGMIGLGRMGANMVRRLMRDGHQCVVYDVYPEAVQALVKEGAVGADVARRLRRQADQAARRLADGAGGGGRQDARRPRRPPARRATSSSTAATRTTSTTSAAPSSCSAKGIHYVDVGTSGGVWGLERGFCQMIGGETEVVQHLDPIFATLAPGDGLGAAHAGPREDDRRHRRARLPALRPERRRALRQDGPQRHRVRPHGRLRRGPEHPAARPTSASRSRPPTPRPRRCASPSTTSTTSTSPTSPRSGGAAASSPRGCST